MSVVLLTRDLMLLSRAQGVTNKLGIVLRNVSSTEQALGIASDESCRGVFIDLREPNLNVVQFVAALRNARPAELFIVACGPHVHKAMLDAAQEAGCDIVVTRGQFERDAEAILQRCINYSA